MLRRLGLPDVHGHLPLLAALAVDALGSGVFLPFSVLFFTVTTPLSLAQVGLALSIAAGIRGYLMINTSPTLLGWAILAARAGRVVVDPQIRRVEPSAAPVGKPLTPEVPLTRREQDVLDELIQGQSNRTIGRNLFISEDTVKSHVKAILRKLGARDRAHAVSLVLSARNGSTCTCSHGHTAEVPADVEAAAV